MLYFTIFRLDVCVACLDNEFHFSENLSSMVGIFSWLKKKEDVDYESLLETMDSEIRKTEMEISSVARNSNRLLNHFLFYSISGYFTFVAVYLLYVKAVDDDLLFTMKTTSLVLIPVLYRLLIRIYMTRSLIIKFYQRKRQLAMEKLQELRDKQQLHVENLKKKTSYYFTKGLIERYDTPPKNASVRSALSPSTEVNTPKNSAAEINNQTTPKTSIKVDKIDGAQNADHNSIIDTLSLKRQVEDRSWFDKILDALIGEEQGPESKYALICENCFSHNGLVSSEEYFTASIYFLMT